MTTESKSRPRPVLGAVAATTMMVLLAGCGGAGRDTAATRGAIDGSQTKTTGAPTTTTVTRPAGSVSGAPSRRPCDLLTKTIAEAALGIPAGAPTHTPGQGNETCTYRAADAPETAMVFLTTYAAKGTDAVLDQAAAQFANAYAVDGVGDAARVSIEEHAIGVLKGDIVFGIGLIPPGPGQGITPVTEAQMIKLATAVLAGI